MNAIFNIIGIPLGYVLWFIYRFVGNYFVSIFLFTLIVRAATFPLSLKSQKSQADRARLAPRLERIQKKYAQDKQKLQQKQMELYEKEGVSMTGGCLPMVVQMVILMGIISVIYSPLTHLARIPEPVISASVTAVTQPTVKNDKGEDVLDSQPNKVNPKDLTGYYRELKMLMVADKNEGDIKSAINGLSDADRKNKTADEYFAILIIVFTYFYTAITINPNQMAEDMKRNNGFIPGIKPGKNTAEYIDAIMSRITLPGSIFLALVAIMPAFAGIFGVKAEFAQFFGGTSLLILVGVVLDTLQQVESHLLMRHYDGLLNSGRIKGRAGNVAAY